MMHSRALLVPLFVLASSLAASRSAHAHHAGPSSSGGLGARTRVGFELETGSFTLDLDGGYWLTACVGAEVALGRRVALTTRLPATFLTRDQGGEAFGLGDADLGVRVLLFEADDFSLASGLAVEFPIGDRESGIGAGHFELSPYVAAASSIDAFSFRASLAYRGSIGVHSHGDDAGAHSHGDDAVAHSHGATAEYALGYHADHEIVASVSGTYTFDVVYLTVGTDVAVALVHSERWGMVRAKADVGFVVDDTWRFNAGVDVPIDPPSGPNWSARVGTDWLF
jgi:hypothetical protein